jgi:hypothetical protein
MLHEFTSVRRIAYFSMEIALENDIPPMRAGWGYWQAIRCVLRPTWRYRWWE